MNIRLYLKYQIQLDKIEQELERHRNMVKWWRTDLWLGQVLTDLETEQALLKAKIKKIRAWN